MPRPATPAPQGLYHPAFEHDACGVGFIAHIKNRKSHEIVRQGLRILENLTHRGATGYDPLLGDGAGILIQMPDAFLREEAAQRGITLPQAGAYACGNVFLPRSTNGRMACESVLARIVYEEGQVFLGWRDVPCHNEGLADAARATEPLIRQVFIAQGTDVTDQNHFERKLFVIRKRVEHAVRARHLDDGQQFYIPSLSSRTLIYKGLLLAHQVGEYYSDLRDDRLVSALALVHQRFSTNTFPTWDLAHPFRMIAHNGEINTLRGNVNWMQSRQKSMTSARLGDDLDKLWPLIIEGQSDSASFDNALELLVMGGYSLAHAMMMLIPEAWSGNPLMDEKRRAFYEFHAAVMEPWDGPAAVAFTDGRQIGATLDRNGLRPARYLVTDDDLVLMASEMGVLDIAQEKIVKKWRLQPGKMFLIDLEAGRIIDDTTLKAELSNAYPYQQWVDEARLFLCDLPAGRKLPPPAAPVFEAQQALGWSQEDLKFILDPMLKNGEEPTGSMGTDTALPVLSDRPKSLYLYFQQLFAQVTNPPIDPIREEIVMSLTAFIGPRPNLMGIADNEKSNDPRLEFRQPVLTDEDIARLVDIERLSAGRFRSWRADMTWPAAEGAPGCEAALHQLCADVEARVLAGFNIIILSDRAVCRERAAIPALLASAAVHHHLVRGGLRTRTGLVVDSGSVREVHHFALLDGYGAATICPWLALASVKSLAAQAGVDEKTAVKNYIKAIGKGLYKVMSKMGISTYQSYTGAQIFEAIGLNADFVARYFTGTPTQIEGIGLAQVAQEAMRTHQRAYPDAAPSTIPLLDNGGEYAFRSDGEQHLWTPDSVAKLQHAVRAQRADTYAEYARLINDQSRRHMTLRGLFTLLPAGPPIAIEAVEPAAEIVKRFATGAMSLGSISTEAHTNLALAMNRIGGKSNTGEGGEDRQRFAPITQEQKLSALIGAGRIERDITLRPGDSLRSAIKQVASGRFGVTAEYLANADQIQIKMAQGAKPGEGGQLPGHKVSEYIGFLRHSVPGVGLISPPPHHDIYSIEDLAQLIHDLKNANPQASISVKLVSEVGVGTVAAGVAKAKADHVVIAGFDGGTGASPISSVKHAGTPWELGLAETQQTLVLNRLRGRIRVQVDGQMKTGRDVVIGALLGADEFGFATAPLVASGCIMMRKCHLNTCPVGVATQDPVLRRRFSGQPEHVVNYFFFVAEEVRSLMAQLGVARFDDLVGRTDLLDMRTGIDHWKARGLDFSKLFHMPLMPQGVARAHCETQDHHLEGALDHTLIARAQATLAGGPPVTLQANIRNAHRTVGTLLSHEIARRYGHDGLPDNSIVVELSGIAGQSFGAFLARGITLCLTGEANDYVGKGLSGGRLIVKPPASFRGAPPEHIIVGNTVLYGATAGEAYFCGVAGERFAVRNSGAQAVVEGVGDHGCEYMTGGTVVVLGTTGRNFAAGMSGGIAYVFDEDGQFAQRCNTTQASLEAVVPQDQQHDCALWHDKRSDDEQLRALIEQHLKATGSPRAAELLADWPRARARFVKVFPHEYRRALTELSAQSVQEAA
jgi:glutamate synthase (NADPH/NADH) large chain